MNVDFTVFKDGQPLKTISVGLPVVIGRGTDSTLTIKHPLLSRRHCEIYEEGGQVYIKDLASLNGTFINEARVETVLPISNGSQLKLGSVEMQVNFAGGSTNESSEADFDMGAVAAAETETMPVVSEAPAASEEASFDLGDFEVNESAAQAVEDADFDLGSFEVNDSPDQAEEIAGDAIAKAESLDLSDFEVSEPEAAPSDEMLDLGEFEVATPAAQSDGPEAQVELPSLMDLASGLDEEVAELAAETPAEAPAAETLTEAPAVDDPWAPPAEEQVNTDDDDLDAFLADLG